MSQFAIPEGQYTSIVYTAIKEERYEDAIEILTIEIQVRMSSPPRVRNSRMMWLSGRA